MSGGGGDSRGQRGRRQVVLDLSKYEEQEVQVKLSGGRQVNGVLVGWDPLMNLVLENTMEELRDPNDPFRLSGRLRKLGLIVARGTSVMTIALADGLEETANPFTEDE